MRIIIENELLELQYIPGNGAWTYQLIIPNTKDIKGKWGDLKVSGTIDGYAIQHKNLGPVKNGDKKLAVNSEIRNAIQKTQKIKPTPNTYISQNTKLYLKLTEHTTPLPKTHRAYNFSICQIERSRDSFYYYFCCNRNMI